MFNLSTMYNMSEYIDTYEVYLDSSCTIVHSTEGVLRY